ncbi:hypothetical protein OA93_19060 [Flavobacterium sp. KMS]|uniref:hypothetical protein n=1 Tax=Flavobacterium sp. KMS TaxID=1566023 RepID=UPI000582E143|nr:hypothetical protein [Flavobacterium sp. KMS]KIA94811.1 hypothetical protein OA93_19060 [Flavobacterium sp. KMS]
MDLRKVEFDKGFSLDFGASEEKRVYGFTYENFENNILKNQMHYEIEIDFKNDNYSNNYILEINRKQIFINNQIPNFKIEQIADKAAQTIFPLCIKVKKNGEIEEILSCETIKKRWLLVKEGLLKYYKEEIILKIIDKIEIVLLNENLLKQSISQNWFFQLYFKPLYVDYTEKLRCKFIWDSPVFGDQSIKYGVVHTIKEHYSLDNKISINADGIAIDERTIDEIRTGYKFPKSKLSGEEQEAVVSSMNVDYKLYVEDRSIFSATGTFETKINEKTQQKIQVELYHFPETSSFRPWSDAVSKENQRIFESYQKEDNDIIDVMAVIREKQALKPEPERILGEPREKIQLYIHEEPVAKEEIGFLGKIKSIFNKNK